MSSAKPSNRAPSAGRRPGSAPRVRPTIASMASANYAAERYSRTPSSTNTPPQHVISATARGNAFVPAVAVHGGIAPRFLHAQHHPTYQQPQPQLPYPFYTGRSGSVGRSSSAVRGGATVSASSRSSSAKRAASPVAFGFGGAAAYDKGGDYGATTSPSILNTIELSRLVDTLTMGGDGKGIFLRYTRGLGPAVVGGVEDASSVIVSSSVGNNATSPSRNTTCIYGSSASVSPSAASVQQQQHGAIVAGPRGQSSTSTIASTHALLTGAYTTAANTLAPLNSRQIPLSFTVGRDSLILTPLVGCAASLHTHSVVREEALGERDPLDSTTNTELHRVAGNDTRRPSVASTATASGGAVAPAGDPFSNTAGPSSGLFHNAHGSSRSMLSAAGTEISNAIASNGNGSRATFPIVIDFKTMERVRLFPTEIEIEAKGYLSGTNYTEMRSNISGTTDCTATHTHNGAGASPSSSVVGNSAPQLSPCLINLVFADKGMMDLCYRLLVCKSRGIVPPRASSAPRGRDGGIQFASSLVGAVNGTTMPCDFAAVIPGQPLLAVGGGDNNNNNNNHHHNPNSYHDPATTRAIRQPSYSAYELARSSSSSSRRSVGGGGQSSNEHLARYNQHAAETIMNVPIGNSAVATSHASSSASVAPLSSAPRANARAAEGPSSGAQRVAAEPVSQAPHSSSYAMSNASPMPSSSSQRAVVGGDDFPASVRSTSLLQSQQRSNPSPPPYAPSSAAAGSGAKVSSSAVEEASRTQTSSPPSLLTHPPQSVRVPSARRAASATSSSSRITNSKAHSINSYNYLGSAPPSTVKGMLKEGGPLHSQLMLQHQEGGGGGATTSSFASDSEVGGGVAEGGGSASGSMPSSPLLGPHGGHSTPTPIPLRTSSAKRPQRGPSPKGSAADGVNGVLVDGLTRDERKLILIQQLSALKAQQQASQEGVPINNISA